MPSHSKPTKAKNQHLKPKAAKGNRTVKVWLLAAHQFGLQFKRNQYPVPRRQSKSQNEVWMVMKT